MSTGVWSTGWIRASVLLVVLVGSLLIVEGRPSATRSADAQTKVPNETQLELRSAGDQRARVDLGFERLDASQLATLVQSDQGRRTRAIYGVPLDVDDEHRMEMWMENAADGAVVRSMAMYLLGSTFGGMWFDRSGDGEFVVGSTSSEGVAKISDWARSGGIHVRAAQSKYSMSELEGLYEEISLEMGERAGFGSNVGLAFVDESRNRVIVFPSADSKPTNAEYERADDRLIIASQVWDSGASRDSVAVGGDRLNSPIPTSAKCSVGASGRTFVPNVGWVHSWVTAGHCENSIAWTHSATEWQAGHLPQYSTFAVYFDDLTPGDSQSIVVDSTATDARVRVDSLGPYGLRYLHSVDDAIWSTANVPGICHSGFVTRQNTGAWVDCGIVRSASATVSLQNHVTTQARVSTCSYGFGGDSGGTVSGLYYPGNTYASLLGFHFGSRDVGYPFDERWCLSTQAGNQKAMIGIGEYVLQ